MARLIRHFVPGTTVHVIKRGNNRMSVFQRIADHEVFLVFLARAAGRHGVAVHAYVLMTTHVHLLLTPATKIGIPKLMKEIGERYVTYFNREYGRIGTIWNGRYRGIPIQDAMYCLTCLRYIEQNPIRAGMVQNAEYRWSSYRAHAAGQWPRWLTPHTVYLSLGQSAAEREASYRAIFGQPVPEHHVQLLR